MSDEFFIKSIAKAFNALDFILKECLVKKGVGLSEISGHLGIQPTTARNILKTMEQCGYVSRAEGHLYIPGTKCREMQRSSLINADIINYSAALLQKAAMETGESFVLSTITNGQRISLIQAKGSGMVSVEIIYAEAAYSVYTLVTTRIMLAFLNDAEIKIFIKKNGLPEKTWNNINSEDELTAECLKLKNTGYSERKADEVFSVAVPFFGKGNILAGSVGSYMPLFRFSEEKRSSMLKALFDNAELISNRIKNSIT